MKGKAPAILEDAIKLQLLAKPITGPAGHRVYFIGTHYNGKETCYDVGSARLDRRPIEVLRRHHGAHKEEALLSWEKVKTELKRIEELPDEREGEVAIVIVPKNPKVN